MGTVTAPTDITATVTATGPIMGIGATAITVTAAIGHATHIADGTSVGLKSMKTVLFVTAAIVGVTWLGTAPVSATPSTPAMGHTSIRVALVANVGYRRRYYRRYGYLVPYAYPPAYRYYLPPAVYAYPPAIGHYPPPVGDYVGAPVPEGEYSGVPDENYPEDAPPDADYANTPPPDDY